jgi:hypothetical protein
MKDGGLRSIFKRKLRQVHWQSIETSHIGAGVPDLNGCYRSVEFWIELKKAKGWSVGLSPVQIAWISRRIRSGGRVFIAVRKGSTLWLLHGAAATALRQQGLRDLPAGALAGCWQGGPAKWPWPAVLGLLASPKGMP